MATPSPASSAPPAAMLQLITGYWVSRAVFVAAKLGLADRLAAGPRSAAELAKEVGAHAPSLHRLMRMLASVGVFAERQGRFELTPLAETLRAGVPGSMRGFALMMVENYNWDAWKELAHGVTTGEAPFHKVFGQRIFQYFADHPEDARVFDEAMTSLSAQENPAVVAGYDFSRFHTLVDVGGGKGHLLAAILRANPRLSGVLFDQPAVVERAAKDVHVTGKELVARIRVVGGDFFESVPSGNDAYIMKYILHDWEEERAVTILRNCAKAMAPGGQVLVVECVLPPGNDPHWGKLLDINMLVETGGLERTEEEFRRLFAEAGLRLTRIVPTACPLSVVEGVAA